MMPSKTISKYKTGQGKWQAAGNEDDGNEDDDALLEEIQDSYQPPAKQRKNIEHQEQWQKTVIPQEIQKKYSNNSKNSDEYKDGEDEDEWEQEQHKDKDSENDSESEVSTIVSKGKSSKENNAVGKQVQIHIGQYEWKCSWCNWKMPQQWNYHP